LVQAQAKGVEISLSFKFGLRPSKKDKSHFFLGTGKISWVCFFTYSSVFYKTSLKHLG